MIPALVLFAVVIAAVAFVHTYNGLVRHRFLTKEAASGIDVQLKRRHDLVPALVSAVSGYAQHERTLFEHITRLRSTLQTASVGGKDSLENELARSLKRLLLVVENYPDLKADGNFLDLQKSLSRIEDDLQMARRYYNGTVRNFNSIVESFPSNLCAGLFGFKSMAFFEIEYVTERAVPDVAFNGQQS